MKKRIEELVTILNEASKAYYQQDREIMSNQEYDALYDELVTLEQETGRDVIKGEYTESVDEEGNAVYTYRYDTYYGVGFGKYKTISPEEFNDIQRYQNETGRQVLYPVVKLSDRPTQEKNKYDANIYYEMENPKASVVRPKLSKDGEIVPNYWKYEVGSTSGLIAEYNSLRIEGEEGVEEALVAARLVVADALYAPVVPSKARLVALPHQAFSGRNGWKTARDLTRLDVRELLA
jgi:hypothetical protein